MLPIWAGAAPGSESWTWSEQVLDVEGGRQVRNVSTPTLEVFPAEATATGMAVIMAPGGAHSLPMVDQEGVHVAGRHAAQGVIALVLRNRVRHTWEGDEEMRRFTVDLDVRIRGTPWSAGRRAIIGEEADHAPSWAWLTAGSDPLRPRPCPGMGNRPAPDRHGWGFSAGGAVTMAPQPASTPTSVPTSPRSSTARRPTP